MNKALFLDLDGTLIETRSGNTFPKDEKDWKFKSRILGKIKQFFDQGYKIIVVTNQAGIDEGYVTPLEFNLKVQNINDQIGNFLRVSAGKYHCWQDQADNVYWMVADYNEHPWRKPRPDAAFFAADKFNINLSKSVMVGDASGLDRFKPTDEPWRFSIEGEKIWMKIDHIFSSEKIDVTNMIAVVDGKIGYMDKDFSDSDKKFAENAGIGTYYDIDEFTKLDLNGIFQSK